MRSSGDVKPEKPPKISTKAQLFVALWRLRIELDALDWAALEMTERDVADARAAWAAIVASMREGLARRSVNGSTNVAV
jgi:hypothetical protein